VKQYVNAYGEPMVDQEAIEAYKAKRKKNNKTISHEYKPKTSS